MESYPRWRDEFIDQLFKTILLLKNEKECYSFFEDLATVNEIKEFSLRFEMARMLNTGSTYEEIFNKTGASSATISRVKRYLNYGADGYKLILERLFGKKK